MRPKPSSAARMADADADADVCAICLGGMVRGQAGFTAECSHAFHLRCISASVAHGNHDCPLCKAPWTVLPAVNAPPPSSSSSSRQVRRTYQDDEPTVPAQAAAANNGGSGAGVVLRTHCEFPALARGAAREHFAVLVHAKAPSSEAARASLDLVTVLDVSGSMAGSKLALLKKAMGFVIDNLGPADRLSVVSFSNNASRLIRLSRMSDTGKAAAKQAVGSLVANGATNIGEGLRVAADVLDCRRHVNAVASIMLLSDGQDTYTAAGGDAADYITLVPSSLRGYNGAGVRPPAVHTFGFGTDHDAAAMHTIAEATGGTFSFIQNQAIVQDAFAQCIGGLLTVVVQEARLAVTCLHPGVRVREVKSGRYDSHVDDDGRASSVDVGELYADEERRFLILMDVPTAEDAEEVTGLVKVSCTYQDAATGQAATVDGDDAVVQRPVEVTGVEPSMEVERERLRVAATEDMAAAREAADRGEHAEGGRILRRRVAAMKCSARAHKDLDCEELEDEMHDYIGLVEDRQQYQKFGHARILSGMSSHRKQRAATVGKAPGSGGRGGRVQRAAYATPAMKKMVDKSREQRQTAAAPAPQPKRKHGRGQQPDSKSGTGKRHKKH
ncbi:hypothetical protein VPH35_017396 [Triticum aestivum]|uniref:E3 ubiquitin-protein ligase WAV3-like n=1 Tax=Triticum aestivum TaxID=4565 RepID=UPI0008426C8A|nr:E3 ubiquitin-protein ligase WAV3-like [Triticum aestivum]